MASASEQMTQRASRAGKPAGIVAVITTAAVGVAHTGLVLSVSDDGSGRLTPPGLDLTRVNSADPATRTAVVELVTEPAPELTTVAPPRPRPTMQPPGPTPASGRPATHMDQSRSRSVAFCTPARSKFGS